MQQRRRGNLSRVSSWLNLADFSFPDIDVIDLETRPHAPKRPTEDVCKYIIDDTKVAAYDLEKLDFKGLSLSNEDPDPVTSEQHLIDFAVECTDRLKEFILFSKEESSSVFKPAPQSKVVVPEIQKPPLERTTSEVSLESYKKLKKSAKLKVRDKKSDNEQKRRLKSIPKPRIISDVEESEATAPKKKEETKVENEDLSLSTVISDVMNNLAGMWQKMEEIAFSRTEWRSSNGNLKSIQTIRRLFDLCII